MLGHAGEGDAVSSDADVVVGAAQPKHTSGHETFVQVERLQQGLCGRSRPHFFRGVATVRKWAACHASTCSPGRDKSCILCRNRLTASVVLYKFQPDCPVPNIRSLMPIASEDKALLQSKSA